MRGGRWPSLHSYGRRTGGDDSAKGEWIISERLRDPQENPSGRIEIGISAKGNRAIRVLKGAAVRCWDLFQEVPVDTEFTLNEPAEKIVLDRDGNRVFVATQSGSLHTYHITSGQLLQSLLGVGLVTAKPIISADGQAICWFMASRSRAMTLRKTRSRGRCSSLGHISCITSPFHRMEHGWLSVELRHRFISWISRREIRFRLYPKQNVSVASRFPLRVTKSTRQISMARSESGPSATDAKSNKSNRANRICSIATNCSRQTRPLSGQLLISRQFANLRCGILAALRWLRVSSVPCRS